MEQNSKKGNIMGENHISRENAYWTKDSLKCNLIGNSFKVKTGQVEF